MEPQDAHRVQEIEARLNLHEQLLSLLFAGVYGSRPDTFSQHMQALRTSLAGPVGRADPLSDATVLEMKVRITVQLDRFEQQTRQRIG